MSTFYLCTNISFVVVLYLIPFNCPSLQQIYSELRQYGATVMAADKQTLRDTSVSEEDGKTVVTFTKLLVEDGETPIKIDGSDNNFLSAYGGDTVGYHTSRTPFTIAFGASSDDDAPSADIKVGDEVCISNYLMDNCEYEYIISIFQSATYVDN